MECGKNAIRLREIGLCIDTGILLSAKAVRVKPLPAATVLSGSYITINWPEALRVSEKSPTRSSSLGTVVVTGNGTRSRKPSYQLEKKSLFLRMGPLTSVEKSFH